MVLGCAVIASNSCQITGEKFNTHGYGGNWGGHYASYHHNIIAHCESRVPRLGPRYTTLALDKGELVDIRNNVYYNYAGEGCYGGEAQKVNLVNNYYKPGPATKLLPAVRKTSVSHCQTRCVSERLFGSRL